MFKYIILLVCLALCCQTLQAERAKGGEKAQWKDLGGRNPALRSEEMAEAKRQARQAMDAADSDRPAAGERSQWNGVVDDEAPNAARSIEEEDIVNFNSWEPSSPKERHARSVAASAARRAAKSDQWGNGANANQARGVEEEEPLAGSNPISRHNEFLEKHNIRSVPSAEDTTEQALHTLRAQQRHDAEKGRLSRSQRERAIRAADKAEAEAEALAEREGRSEAGVRSQWNNAEDDGKHSRNVAEELELERPANSPKLRHQQQLAKFAREQQQDLVQPTPDTTTNTKDDKETRRKVQNQRMTYLHQQQVQKDEYKANREPHPNAPQGKEEEIRPFHSIFLFGLPLLGVAAIAAAAALFMHQMKQDRQEGYVSVPTNDASSRHSITIAPSPILKSTGKGMTPNDILAAANTPDMKKMSNKQKNKLMNESRRSPKISTPRLRSSQTFTQI